MSAERLNLYPDGSLSLWRLGSSLCSGLHQCSVQPTTKTSYLFTTWTGTIAPSFSRRGRFSAATPSISRNGPRADRPEPGEPPPALSTAPTSEATWTSQPAYPTPGLGFKGNEEEVEDNEGKKEDVDHASIETYPVKSNH